MPRPATVMHPGPGVDIVCFRAGGVSMYRGAVIHQGDACVAPTIGVFIGGPWCRHPSRSGVDIVRIRAGCFED
ncbi:MAG: hypothetical protein SV239_08590 [Thermodesulfobacteriota bacterium]|jgi:hypothetical protein|nr:hypothetical protein [Thermodesulfobacteriota bacterium]